MNTFPPGRQNLRMSSLNQYETYMREQGELETDPHPSLAGAVLVSLLCWGVVVLAIVGVWTVARWVLS